MGSLCVLCENKKCPNYGKNIKISWNCIKFYSSLKERGKRIKMNLIDDYKGNIEAVKKI